MPDHLQEYLSKLNKPNDYIKGKAGMFTMRDLSVISKETGIEFAVVTVGDKAYLIRGTKTGTSIPENIIMQLEEHNGTLDFHSHPYDGDNIPSVAVREVIGMLEEITGESKSRIVTTDGKVTVFNKHGVINIESVDNSMTDYYKKMLEELFGGE